MDKKTITIKQICDNEYAIEGVSLIKLLADYFNFDIERSYDSTCRICVYKCTYRSFYINYSKEYAESVLSESRLYDFLVAAKEEVNRLEQLKQDLDKLKEFSLPDVKDKVGK